MPRYHFNVYDGVDLHDGDGMELPHFAAARFEAVRRAGAILQDQTHSVALGEDWRIEVTDHKGLILFQMTFVVFEAPAVLRPEHVRRS